MVTLLKSELVEVMIIHFEYSSLGSPCCFCLKYTGYHPAEAVSQAFFPEGHGRLFLFCQLDSLRTSSSWVSQAVPWALARHIFSRFLKTGFLPRVFTKTLAYLLRFG